MFECIIQMLFIIEDTTWKIIQNYFSFRIINGIRIPEAPWRLKMRKVNLSLIKPQAVLWHWNILCGCFSPSRCKPSGCGLTTTKSIVFLPQVREKLCMAIRWHAFSTESWSDCFSSKPDLNYCWSISPYRSIWRIEKIAPTVMFDSRHESYQENLETAQKIGDLVGKK